MSDAPPLVLLHPLGSNRTFWDTITPELAGRQVLPVDLPGHGAVAPAAPGTTLADLAEHVVEQLHSAGSLEPGERFSVAGVSLGGLVAQHLAAQYADLVDRLILVDTVHTYPPAFRESWRERAHLARTQGLEPLFPAMAEMWFTAKYREERPDVVAEVRRQFLGTPTEGYARACEALEQADTRALLPTLAAPTLIVCGTQDAPAFIDSTHEMSRSIPDARVHWLTGAKHAAALEQVSPFAAAVTTFLR